MQKTAIEAFGIRSHYADFYIYTGTAQRTDTSPRNLGIGILECGDHPFDAGIYEESGTRWRTSLMTAGFQIDIHAGSACSVPRLA
jgi:hypothetical protein